MNTVVKDLGASKLNFTIDDEGEVEDFLGVKFQKNKDGTITLTQPQLIDSILKDLPMQGNTGLKQSQHNQVNYYTKM